MNSQSEESLRSLASRLSFTLEKQGSGYSLYRETDVSTPVGHQNLTLKQVQEILETWKLRGPHGG